MKPRTLLVLLVLVVGFGAFIWLYERKLPSSEEREAQGKKVFALEKKDVTAVAIDSSKGSVRLEKSPAARTADKDKKDAAAEPPAADWKLVRPLAARADAFAVDRLLDAVANLQKSRTLEDVDPKAVGLDKPRATVRLTTKDGEKVLRIGAEVPPGGSTIAGIEGQKGAYVVADSILSEVDKAPGEWRDHSVFRGNREAVQRITRIVPEGTPASYDRALLASDPEQALVVYVDELPDHASDALPQWVPDALPVVAPLSKFFDDVMLMVDDEQLRAARLGLVQTIVERAPRGIDWRALNSAL